MFSKPKLSGSERPSQTTTEGIRFQEGCLINKKLLALANVINRPSEGGRYCNNMLTQYMHTQGFILWLHARKTVARTIYWWEGCIKGVSTQRGVCTVK